MQDLLELYEDYSDVLRAGASVGPGQRMVSTCSNNIYMREQLRRHNEASRQSRSGGCVLRGLKGGR